MQRGQQSKAAKARAAAANATKWRQESQESREALEAGVRSDAGSPDADMFEAIPRMRLNLAEFWRKHRQDFTDYWARLPDEERRGFILAGSPYMSPEGGEMQATDLLMPEINVRSLKTNLIKLMEYRATTSEQVQESDDYKMIMQLNSNGLLPYFPTAEGEVYCPPQKKALVIKDHNNPRVKEFLANGIFIDMRIWKPLATRQFYTLQHLTLYADDYRREVLDKHGYKTMMGTSVCRVCQAKKKPDGGSLLQCGRCRAAKYCSAACQRQDWPAHKLACTQTD